MHKKYFLVGLFNSNLAYLKTLFMVLRKPKWTLQFWNERGFVAKRRHAGRMSESWRYDGVVIKDLKIIQTLSEFQ